MDKIMIKLKFCAVFFIILCTSCSFLSPQKKTILEKSHCAAPCWNNIKVGETTKKELLDEIKKLSFVDQESIKIISRPGYFFNEKIIFVIYSKTFLKNENILVEAQLINDIVVELTFAGALGVTIGEITELTGHPDYITNFRGGEQGGNKITLIDIKNGISFSYLTNKIPSYLRTTVDPKIQLMWLTYFSPQLWNRSEYKDLYIPGYKESQSIDNLYTWRGYGNLFTLYPEQTLAP